MKRIKIVLIFCFSLYFNDSYTQIFTKNDIERCQNQAKNITIIRDNWGIPHVYGKTDADAVFGLLYAQCEDDFGRIEMNYIEKLGRLSEINGESSLSNDLQIRMMIDSTDAIVDYKKAQPWLKKLLNAYADGINYYLYKHPETKPVIIKTFKPWYPLLWTDGSIGAINTADITLQELKDFYSGQKLSFKNNQKQLEYNLNQSINTQNIRNLAPMALRFHPKIQL
jgi:acyl-homoserine-lactone acylase